MICFARATSYALNAKIYARQKEHKTETYLSKCDSDRLSDTWEGPGLGVVLQQDAVALENHIWLPVDHQRALERRELHRVAKLAAIGRHLVDTW